MDWREREQQKLYDEYLQRDKQARRYLFWYRLRRGCMWVAMIIIIVIILFVLFGTLYEDGSFRFLGMSGCIPFMLCY